jgi:small conductance mechanosensitive channel
MEKIQAPLISTLVVVVVALLTMAIFRRIGDRYVRRIAEEDPEKGARMTTLWIVVKRLIQVIIVFIAVLLVFSIWEISMAPFLAVGTVLAAAVGFGAQDLVKDVIAGFFIIAEDQFHIGDTITIAGTTGTVDDIQFRVTVLRDFEGKVHFVPNGQITVTTNFTDIFAQPVIDVGIAYKEDVDRAMAVMLEELDLLSSDEDWSPRILGEAELIGVQELGDSAVVIRGRLTTDADERWAVRREAFRRIKNRFDQEGIEIPFPHVTVYYGEG